MKRKEFRIYTAIVCLIVISLACLTSYNASSANTRPNDTRTKPKPKPKAPSGGGTLAPQATFTYDNTTAGAITDNNCAAPLSRTFTVTENFTINDLNVGFNASHTRRGELRVTLQSPAGTSVQIIASSGDTDDNYDVLLDSASGNALDDNNIDNTASPFYDRTAAPSNSLNAFNGQSSLGTWTMTICDSVATTTGTFNRARLVFDGTPVITGVVFRDYDGDGTRDAAEHGVGNIVVTAYDSAGTAQGSTTTAASGAYTLAPTGSAPYRIEFTSIPSYLRPGPFGPDSGTTVQFMSTNSGVANLGLVDPVKFAAETNPTTVTTCFVTGAYNGANATSTSVLTVPFNATGHDFTGNNHTASFQGVELTQWQETGAAYGLAWQGKRDRIYVGSFHKRYSGFGPNGPDAIYVINAAGTIIGTIELDAITGISNVAGADVHDFTAQGGVVYDIGASNASFDGVGKRSLGDLDISADQNTLYVVNLFNRRIYAINVSDGVPGNASLINSWAAPDATGAGRHRPFALAWHKDKLWVGSVDENSTNAYIHSFDPDPVTNPSATFTLEVTVSLTFARQAYFRNANQAGNLSTWRAWANDPVAVNYMTSRDDGTGSTANEIAYPQPMLSDIEFDGEDMILGFRDRFGDQSGSFTPFEPTESGTLSWGVSAGDILRVCRVGSSYVVEAGGGCGTSGGLVNSGPGGATSPEHYNWDTWELGTGTWDTNSNTGGFHWETAQGGLVQVAGKASVLTTALDPIDDYSGGYLRLDNATGRREGINAESATFATVTANGGYTIYEAGDFGDGGNGGPPDNPNLLAKANGLGDIEALVAPAPLEIGNRVWNDANQNGVQDAGESPLVGVTVRLYRNGSLVGTAVTNANGQYLFVGGTSADPNTADERGIVNGGILNNTAYEIRLDNATNFQAGGPLNGLFLTGANSTASSGDDEADDSDAFNTVNPSGSPAGTFPVISITTGGLGENNHTFDIGLAAPTATYSVGNFVWYDTDNDGVFDATEVGVAGISVSLINSLNAVVATVTTDANGFYRFDGIAAGNYTARVNAGNFGSGNTLQNYRSSTTTEANPNSDVDLNDNGIDNATPATNGIASGTVTVGVGATEPVAENEPTNGYGSGATTGVSSIDPQANLTVDFSFFRLSLSGTVWNDGNPTVSLRDNGVFDFNDSELGMAGLTVRLFDSTGATLLATTTTAANGGYLFDNLAPGSYVVKVTPPANYRSSTPTDTTPNNDEDHDDNGADGTGGNLGLVVSNAITLAAGSEPIVNNALGFSTNPTLDFGLFSPLGPTAIELLHFSATQSGGGVRLSWKSGAEVDNLGFRIYREVNGIRSLVTQQVIAGSALTFGPATTLRAGHSYAWTDRSATMADAMYWLEDIDLNGISTMHGPFAIEQGAGKFAAAADALEDSTLLTKLGDLTDAGAAQQRQVMVDKVRKSASQSVRGQAVSTLDVAAQRAVKMTIKEEGWYRVSFAELVEAGLDAKFDPQSLQLFVGGQEVPMLVSSNPEGGAIEFYANGQESLYSQSRVYWLIANGQPGKRMAQVKSEAKFEEGTSFDYTIELRERLIYFAALRNGEQENFFGRVITSAPVEHRLRLDNLDAKYSGSASLQISLQGATELETLNDHSVSVQINGAFAGRLVFDGQQRFAQTFRIPHSLLRAGDNIVTLTSEGGANDISVVDFIRVTYRHTAVADADALKMAFDARKSPTQHISGFTTPLIRVFDITNANSPVEMIGVITSQDQGYTVSVQAAPTGTRTLLALTDEQFKRPLSLSLNQPSTLKSRENQADMVMIAHGSFIPALAALQSLRESQGIKVSVVDVEDIYDEFNFGVKSAQAIRDFLSTTRSWARAPRFVLLVGDASLDPKNYLSPVIADFVPIKFIDTELFETVTDDWFADFNNDRISDLAIGRLPVRTVGEASAVIGKMLAYEQSPIRRRSALLIADRNEGFDFETTTNQLQGLLPTGMQAQKIFRSQTSDPAARTQIINVVNEGVSVVNYAGHGSNQAIQGNLLRHTDAAVLSGARPSVFLLMTCLSGYFQSPEIRSLAEALLLDAQGGAVAVWSSSGLTQPDGQAAVNLELFRQLFSASAKPTTLGEAILKAKLLTSNMDTRQTWILFGDPTLRVQ